jgi:hypothetical protein
MSETAWRVLDAELERWAALDLKPQFWLRDDDAVDATDPLDRLLSLCAKYRIPLALAVIPAGATVQLAQRLQGLQDVSVLQHGFAHASHAVGGEKKSEFAENRPLDVMTGELVQGRDTLSGLFGDAALPVLAPPWNRVGTDLVAHLADAGLSGLTRYKARASHQPAPGVIETNTHVDLIHWRDSRTGAALAEMTAGLAAHLVAKRTGAADREEATGILAHHLVMDRTAWATLKALLAKLAADPRVSWPSSAAIFGAKA